MIPNSIIFKNRKKKSSNSLENMPPKEDVKSGQKENARKPIKPFSQSVPTCSKSAATPKSATDAMQQGHKKYKAVPHKSSTMSTQQTPTSLHLEKSVEESNQQDPKQENKLTESMNQHNQTNEAKTPLCPNFRRTQQKQIYGPPQARPFQPLPAQEPRTNHQRSSCPPPNRRPLNDKLTNNQQRSKNQSSLEIFPLCFFLNQISNQNKTITKAGHQVADASLRAQNKTMRMKQLEKMRYNELLEKNYKIRNEIEKKHEENIRNFAIYLSDKNKDISTSRPANSAQVTQTD